jgi:hypothetical protein
MIHFRRLSTKRYTGDKRQKKIPFPMLHGTATTASYSRGHPANSQPSSFASRISHPFIFSSTGIFHHKISIVGIVSSSLLLLLSLCYLSTVASLLLLLQVY